MATVSQAIETSLIGRLPRMGRQSFRTCARRELRAVSDIWRPDRPGTRVRGNRSAVPAYYTRGHSFLDARIDFPSISALSRPGSLPLCLHKAIDKRPRARYYLHASAFSRSPVCALSHSFEGSPFISRRSSTDRRRSYFYARIVTRPVPAPRGARPAADCARGDETLRQMRPSRRRSLRNNAEGGRSGKSARPSARN